MRKGFFFVVGQTKRSVAAPPNPATVLFIALARVVLTLVEFTQAARVAEGADHPRLPAAPALHPTLCRPDLTPRSLRRSAAPEPLHNPGKRGWEEGGYGGKAATFPVWHIHAHTFTQTWERCGRSLFQFLSAAPHCFPFFQKRSRDARVQRDRHVYDSSPHASLRAGEPRMEGREERHGEKLRADRARQPALIHTGPQCIAPPLLTPLPPI